MARSNGRPEPEVIVNFADGMGYSKGKMEEAFRQGGLLDKPVIKGNKEIAHAKREDVDLIVCFPCVFREISLMLFTL
ncbi:hypothetical protein EIP86_010847 [Pleurotus ostreatoroseus]|nr:hypothetical protein EIP86_010847 [Pleurotus ostreatoroseus]